MEQTTISVCERYKCGYAVALTFVLVGYCSAHCSSFAAAELVSGIASSFSMHSRVSLTK